MGSDSPIGARPRSALKRFLRAGPLALSMLLALSVIYTQPVNADTFGGCYGDGNEGCVPVDRSHSYCWTSSMTTAFQSHATSSMTYLDAYTSYSTPFHSTCGTSTDARWMLASLGASTRGRYTCDLITGDLTCQRATLRLNPDLLTDGNNRRKTACHELGHSAGLRHGGTADCMLNGAVTAPTSTYSTHHITHINNRA